MQIVRLLSICIALHCWGLAAKHLWIELEIESPVFGQLLFGWGWPERIAQSVDDWGMMIYFASGLTIALAVHFDCRWFPVDHRFLTTHLRYFVLIPLVYIVIWHFFLTTAAWYRGSEYFARWSFFDLDDWSIPLVFLSHASRFAAPMVLIILLHQRLTGTSLVDWFLRVSAAATFLGHGIKAICGYGTYLDYLLMGAKRFSWDVSETMAHHLLWTIGWLDAAVALWVMVRPTRFPLVYMTIWAAIAAGSRVMHSGLEAYHEVLVRAPNYFVPLVLLLWLSRSNVVLKKQED